MTTTVIGIALIYMAVYNASTELEIIHEINTFERLTVDKLAQYPNPALTSTNYLETLAANISPENLKIFKFPQNTTFTIKDITFDNIDIQQSNLTSNGGYFTKNQRIIAWSLLPVGNSNSQLLIAHLHHSSSGMPTFNAYKNRLIIPAVFFIWMTVWGGLILSHLITSIHEEKEKAEYSSLHDTLTGLPNRKQFSTALDQLCSYSATNHHSFCIVVVDLDDFKTINDTYGHNAGDEVLIEAAMRFQKTIRVGDLAARLGGDEFILLLPNLEIEAAFEIFERIHSSLTKPYSIGENTLQIGASLGVSLFPAHATRPTELIRRADLAMYSAKKQKSGIEVYDEAMYSTSYINTSTK